MKPLEAELKHKLKQRQQQRPVNFWSALGLIGTVGWVFVLPTVGGAYLGWWLDGQYRLGRHSWTLTLLLLGIGLGIYLLYRRVYLPSLRPPKDQE